MLLAEPWVYNGMQRNVWECCVYTIGMTSLFSTSSKLNMLKNNEICVPHYPSPPSLYCVCLCSSPHFWGVYLPSSLQRFLKYLLRAEQVNDCLKKQDWICWATHWGMLLQWSQLQWALFLVSVSHCSTILADPLKVRGGMLSQKI